jgi:hypothetical protein
MAGDSYRKGTSTVRHLSLLSALLLSLALTLPAVAQTPAATPETLPGLQYVAARQYAPDPSQPINAEDEGLYLLSVRIYHFDSEAHADNGWESTVESTTIQDQLPEASDTVQFEEVDIDDLGDRAWATTLSAETPEGATGFFRLVYVQDGEMLYTLNAIAGSDEATMKADELAAYLVDAEPGDAEPVYSPDGTSTGGTWDLLPASDDDVLGDLIAYSDAELDLRGGD